MIIDYAAPPKSLCHWNAHNIKANAITARITQDIWILSLVLNFLFKMVNKTAAITIAVGCSTYVFLEAASFINVPASFAALNPGEKKNNIIKPISAWVWKKIIVNNVDFLNNLVILPEYPNIVMSKAIINIAEESKIK